MPVTAWVQGTYPQVLSAFREQPCMQRQNPWQRHVVLVPSERAGRWLLQSLAAEGGALHLEPMTIARFAQMLLPDLPLSSPASLKRLQMEAAIAEAAVAMPEGPGLPEALLAIQEELAAAGVGPEELPEDDAGVRRVLLHYAQRTARDRNAENLLPTAAWAVARGGTRLPDHLDLLGFTGLSPLEAELVGALREVLPLSIFLPLPALDAPPSPAARRLREALGLPPHRPDVPLPPVRALPAPHGAAEADLAARRVLQDVADGTPPGRIAVFGDRAVLHRLAFRLDAAGIPVDAPLPSFAASPFGAAALRFSLLLRHDRAEDLLELLSGPTSDPWAAGFLREMLEGLADRNASTRLAAFRRLPEKPGNPDNREEARSMADLLEDTLNAVRGETWEQFSAAFFQEAVRLLVQPTRWEREMEVLEAIRSRLTGLEGCGIPCSPTRFGTALTAELAAARAPVPRQPVPGVRLLRWGEPLGVPADLLIGLGLAEDEFPPASPGSPLLPDSVRRSLGDRLPTAAARRARLLEEAGAALGGAREVVAVYTAESRLVPKRLFAPLAPAGGISSEGGDLPVVDPLSLWTAGGRDAAAALAARSLLAAETPPTPVLQARDAWQVDHWTEYDGEVPTALVSDDPRKSPRGEAPPIWSPSELETFGACGYRYLVSRLLEVEEAPLADDLDLDPITRGHLAHTVLDRARKRLAGAAGRTGLSLLREVLAEEIRSAVVSQAQRPLLQAGLLALEADLFHFLARSLEEETLYSEWKFGDDGNMAIPLPRGDLLRYRGRVDWIGWSTDVDGNRCLAVVDYKTGRPPDGRLAPGNLQIPLYLLAVSRLLGQPLSRLEGRYASVTAKGEFRLVRIPGNALDPQEVAGIVEGIVTGIAAGRFHPSPDDHCTYCACQGFCPRDAAPRKGEGEGGDG